MGAPEAAGTELMISGANVGRKVGSLQVSFWQQLPITLQWWGGLGVVEGDAAMVFPRCPHGVPGAACPAGPTCHSVLVLCGGEAAPRPAATRYASCIMHGARSSGECDAPRAVRPAPRCADTPQPGPHPPPFVQGMLLHRGGARTSDGHLHKGIAFAQGNCICPQEGVHVGTSGDTGTSPAAPPAAAVPVLSPELIHHRHSGAWHRAATASTRSPLLFAGLNSRGSGVEA